MATRKFGDMDKNELYELKQKYLGQQVYAGSVMKGYYGTICDIVPDEDIPNQVWFVVSNDSITAGGGRRFEKWDKGELQKVIVTTKLVPLD